MLLVRRGGGEDGAGNSKGGWADRIDKIFRYAVLQLMSLAPILALLLTRPGPSVPLAVVVSFCYTCTHVPTHARVRG